jgi:hypothetical protein
VDCRPSGVISHECEPREIIRFKPPQTIRGRGFGQAALAEESTAMMFGPDHFVAINSSIAKIEKKLFEKAPPQQRREIEALIGELKAEIAKINTAFAQSVGFPIYHCKPPTGVPMAWIEPQSAYVCPECGHRKEQPKPVRYTRDRSMRRVRADNDWDIFTGK